MRRHSIRNAEINNKFPTQLQGIIEADETYIGGRPRYKDKDNKRGRGTSGKTSVVGAVQREGEVRAEVTDDTKDATVLGFIEQSV